MANKLYDETSVSDIANAIREKNGTQNTYKVSQMGAAVRAIQTEKPTQSKTVTPTAAGLTVTPDSGKVLSSVTVNGDADLVSANIRNGINIFGVTGTLEEGITPSGTKTITENGTYDVTQFASANVDVRTQELPENFQRLEWVSGANPSLIIPIEDSGRNLTIITDMLFLSSNSRAIIGGNTSGGCYFDKSTTNKFSLGSSVELNSNPFERNKVGYFRQSNTTAYLTVAGETIERTISATIDAWHPFTVSGYSAAGCKVWDIFISQKGVITGEYKPCYRKSDEVTGLYNTIDNTFIYPASGTALTRGPEI